MRGIAEVLNGMLKRILLKLGKAMIIIGGIYCPDSFCTEAMLLYKVESNEI